MTKFKFEVYVVGESLVIDLIRLKDNKVKKFYFNNCHPPIVEPYVQFMNSLTDDLCEGFMKG